jgi:hypothetical protein
MVRYFGIIDTRHRVCGSMVVANPILPGRREQPIMLLPSSEEASEASLLANRRHMSGAKNPAPSTSLFGCNRRALGLVAATSSPETAAENAETEGARARRPKMMEQTTMTMISCVVRPVAVAAAAVAALPAVVATRPAMLEAAAI